MFPLAFSMNTHTVLRPEHCRPLGSATLSQLWLKSLPKVKLSKPLRMPLPSHRAAPPDRPSRHPLPEVPHGIEPAVALIRDHADFLSQSDKHQILTKTAEDFFFNR